MKFSVYGLIFTVFLFWLTTQINSVYEEYLSYLLILTIGIVHGSNDISLIKVVKGHNKLSIRYLMLYVGLIIFNICAFLFSPTLALFFFILISCYHFGEQHFHHQIKTHHILSQLLFFSYGNLIFGLLFYFNANNTSEIINELTGLTLIPEHFLWFLIIGITLTAISILFNFKKFGKDFNPFKEVFLVFLFMLLFKLAALLWAFAIYFVVWHSLPSLMDQIKTLYGNTNKTNIIRYIKSSFIYWLISITGLVILYFSTTYFKVNFVTIFFAFLAAITVPHVVVMYFLYKK